MVKEAHGGIDEGVEWTPCEVRDFSKLTIRDGKIHYVLYAQDGKLTPMEMPNTYSNRLLVSWIQIHDRYMTGPEYKARLHEKPGIRDEQRSFISSAGEGQERGIYSSSHSKGR